MQIFPTNIRNISKGHKNPKATTCLIARTMEIFFITHWINRKNKLKSAREKSVGLYQKTSIQKREEEKNFFLLKKRKLQHKSGNEICREAFKCKLFITKESFLYSFEWKLFI